MYRNFYNFHFFQAQAQKKTRKLSCCCIYCIDFLYIFCASRLPLLHSNYYHPNISPYLRNKKIKQPTRATLFQLKLTNCLFFFFYLNIFGSIYIELRMGWWGCCFFYSLNWVMYNLHNDPLPFSVFFFSYFFL